MRKRLMDSILSVVGKERECKVQIKNEIEREVIQVRLKSMTELTGA